MVLRCGGQSWGAGVSRWL